MKRRTALAAAAASFGATAGCLGLLPSRPDGPLGGGAAETTTSPPDGGTTSESPAGRTTTDGVQTSSGDDETQNGSSAAIETCPSSVVENTSVQEPICNGKQTDADLYLTAESGTVSPPGSIDFTLRNLTGGTKLYSACRWTAYKQSNQGWKTVRPLEGDKIDKNQLGGFETLTLYIGREPSTDAGQCPYSLDSPSPGRYLFGVQGSVDGETTLFLASFQVTQ